MAKSQKKRDIPAGAVAVATNRAARRDYDILDTLEVGIQLRGSEVKSLRESKVQLAEAYAIVFQNELWLVGLHIAPYSYHNTPMDLSTNPWQSALQDAKYPQVKGLLPRLPLPGIWYNPSRDYRQKLRK